MNLLIISILILFSLILFTRFREREAECGHKTRRTNTVSAFGRTVKIKIKPQNGIIEYCHKCVGEMTIQCAWCEDPIFIGDPITLYTPKDESFEIPEHAVVYKKDPLQLVGCLGWNCAHTGGDRAGFWIPPGNVHRMLSPIEQVMRNVSMGDDSPVIISDLSKP